MAMENGFNEATCTAIGNSPGDSVAARRSSDSSSVEYRLGCACSAGPASRPTIRTSFASVRRMVPPGVGAEYAGPGHATPPRRRPRPRTPRPLARDRTSVPEIELLDGGDANAVRVVLVGIELILAQVHRTLEREAVGQLDVTEAIVAAENAFRGPGQIEELHLPRVVVAPHTAGDESERVVQGGTDRRVMVQLRVRGARLSG